MPLSRSLGVSLTGLDAQLVEIECDISAGLPGLSFTGLPDTSVMESRDRLRAALLNSGADWPNRKITVALLPADLRKTGSRFDLAVGIAVLAAAEQVPGPSVERVAWIAELGLDGRLRPVRGVLPSVLAAARAGVDRVVVAPQNVAEARLVPGVDARTAETLRELVDWLTGAAPLADAGSDCGAGDGAGRPFEDPVEYLADVAGQAVAKRALEIAAAGGHHLAMVGYPGAGKTMLAQRLPGLLPPLDDAASLEVTAVHSIAGLLDGGARLVRRPPLQAPHHTASVAALVGGGSHLARPGAVSLAHHGVLFLDEAPEFSPQALDALRQPLESGHISLARSGGTVSYPARFQLVLAANPCACGRAASQCSCSAAAQRRHAQRLSGPLLDRIDLRVDIDPVPHADLFGSPNEREDSAAVAARVAAARSAAADRWRRLGYDVNAAVPGRVLRSGPHPIERAALREAEGWVERGELSARGFDRVLRLAWTIADLAGRDRPSAIDVGEALFYRTGRSESWAA